MSIAHTCAGCGRPLVPYGRARSGDAVMHCGRNLCSTCYSAAHTSGALDDYPPSVRPSADTLADWEILRARGMTRAEAAEHVGMTRVAFAQAITRGRKAANNA